MNVVYSAHTELGIHLRLAAGGSYPVLGSILDGGTFVKNTGALRAAAKCGKVANMQLLLDRVGYIALFYLLIGQYLFRNLIGPEQDFGFLLILSQQHSNWDNRAKMRMVY